MNRFYLDVNTGPNFRASTGPDFRASGYRDETQLPLSCHLLPQKMFFTNTVQNVSEEFIISRYRKTNYRAKSGVPAISRYQWVNFRNNDKNPVTAQK